VNAYEIKAGMVCLQCNNCVIHTRALQRRSSHNGALYKSMYLLPLAYNGRDRTMVQHISLALLKLLHQLLMFSFYRNR